MRTVTRLHLLVLVGLSLSGLPALADQVSGAVRVSATVRPTVRLAFDAPPAIMITELDLSRGYLDLTEDAVLSFQTNNPSGFVVVGAISDPAFTRADVSGFGGELQITAAGGFSVLPFTGTSRQTRKLAVRLFLADGTAAGERAFPVSLSARLARASSVSAMPCHDCSSPASQLRELGEGRLRARLAAERKASLSMTDF